MTVDVPVVVPVLNRFVVNVCDSSSVNCVAEKCTFAPVVGVPVGVAVGVPVAVGVAVGVPVGVTHAPPKISENARTEPVSPPALSLAFSVHVPFAFWPSNADRGLFGENDPVNGPTAGQKFSIDGNPPSSSSVRLNRLFVEHPKVDAGTPGRSKNVTDVPPGDVSLKARSPTHEWLTPTVVDNGSSLGAVPPNRKLRSAILPTPATTIGILTPAGSESGISTAAPV